MSTYWQYYGMETDPFIFEHVVTPSYISPQWDQQLDLLLHLSLNSNAILVVSGVSGIGKSTLSREFLSQIQENVGVCEIQGDVSVSVDILKQLLARHFGLQLHDAHSDEFYDLLAQQIQKLDECGEKYLIVIDDAHLLPEESVLLLLDILAQQTDHINPLHLLMLGGPQLDATMTEVTNQHSSEHITHTVHLEPLTYEAMQQYMYHYLESVGFQGELPLTESELKEVYQHSGGIPGKVNYFTQRALEMKMPKQHSSQQSGPARVLDHKRIAMSIAGIAVVLILLTGIVKFWKGGHAQDDMMLADNDTNVEASYGQPHLISPNDNQPAQQDQQQMSSLAMELDEQQVPPQMQTPTNDAAAGQNNVAEELAIQETVTETEVTQVQPLPTPKPANKPAAKPTAPKQHVTKAQPKPTPHHAAVQHKKLAAHKKNPSAQHHGSSMTAAEKLLLATNSSHYTLQLMGTHSKAHLQQFITNNHLQGQVWVFHTDFKGENWYVAVFGDYRNKQQAMQAIVNLPMAVQAQQPWARSYASVHDAIRKANHH